MVRVEVVAVIVRVSVLEEAADAVDELRVPSERVSVLVVTSVFVDVEVGVRVFVFVDEVVVAVNVVFVDVVGLDV